MSGYTPGPWHVVRHNHVDDELWLSVNQRADAAGMQEWIAEIKYLTTEPERQWANARLIASAPELYEALKALADVGESITPGKILAARAAIAKADGGK